MLQHVKLDALWTPGQPRRVEAIIIHATWSDDVAGHDYPGMVRWAEGAGYKDGLVYDFVAEMSDGVPVVHVSRPLLGPGAHCRPQRANRRTLGFAFECKDTAPPEALMNTSLGVLRWLLSLYGLTPDRVLGHNQVADTLCPGKVDVGWMRKHL